jgi:pSer/pThr/pTyr-binding forkhead associated (FHA) protein
VHVQHERIRSAVTLQDGDHIRICDYEFTFEIARKATDTQID